MSIQFVIGPTGSGKTSYCLNEIRTELKQQPTGAPLIILVPEQASFETEHALVTTPGLNGMIRSQVLSFRRMAHRVIQETGGAARQPIDETGKKMLLFRIWKQLNDELKTLHTEGGKIGWIDKLYDFFTELRRYQVTAKSFHQVLIQSKEMIPDSSWSEKLEDLNKVYALYEQHLAQGYIDGEGVLDQLAVQISNSDYLRNATIYIDGFNGFTPQELKVIGELMQVCPKVVITLCLDRDYSEEEELDELNLFYPVATTLRQLKKIANAWNAAIEPVLLLSVSEQSRTEPVKEIAPDLLHLRRHYGAGESYPQEDPAHNIQLRSTANRRTEVEEVAREILRLVREHHYRWRDMLIMVRQPELYHDLIETVFADYGIPCYIDQKHPVNHHPLIEFILSAVEVVRQRWRYDAVFRCVKTDFLLPFDPEKVVYWREQMDQLENYVLAFGIQGSRWLNDEPWTYKWYRNLEEDGIEQSDAEIYLDRVNKLRHLVAKPLATFQRRLQEAKTVRMQAEAVYLLLEDVKATDRLEWWSEMAVKEGVPLQAKEHVQVWANVIQVLDQIVEAMGTESVSLEWFAGMLETGLQSIEIGLVPPALDQVMVGNMDRSIISNKRFCFLLGVNSGVLPAPMIEDGLLTEIQREWLQTQGMPLAPGSRRKLLDEQFLVYSLVTLPDTGLWISYPLADEEGKALLPSEIFQKMKTMFPYLKVVDSAAEPSALQNTTQQLHFINRPLRTLSHLTVQLRQWTQGSNIDPIWWAVYNWFIHDPYWEPKVSKVLSGLFLNNREKRLQSDTSRKLYGDPLTASVSRMEKFVSCPFAHFMAYGLRLKQRRVFRLEAPDIGQLFHAALHRLSQQLQQERRSWSSLSEKECMSRAQVAVNDLAPRLQGEILLSSKRYRYIAHKLKQIVGRTSYVLSQQAERGSFNPVGLELDFGRNGVLPPLMFELENGVRMEVAGRIDRVDHAPSEQGLLLRVIDYKSSQTPLRLADVYYGLSLQMLAYLDVVVTYAEQWLGEPAIPAGVLYFHVHNPLLQTKNELVKADAKQEWFRRFKMGGWVLSDTAVIKNFDHSLKQGYSDLIPVGLRANGELYKNSSVYSAAQWSDLQQYLRNVMKQIGTDITTGRVEAAPYQLGGKSPCQYCEFQSICQFDPQIDGNEYRHLSQHPSDQLWQFIRAQTKQSDKGGHHREP